VTADTVIKILLIGVGIVMALLAFAYLSRRQMPWNEYLAFGLLAIVVPMLGPFLVIALRPGEPRRTPQNPHLKRSDLVRARRVEGPTEN